MEEKRCRCKQDRTLKVVAQSSDQSGSARGEARARSGLESRGADGRHFGWQCACLCLYLHPPVLSLVALWTQKRREHRNRKRGSGWRMIA